MRSILPVLFLLACAHSSADLPRTRATVLQHVAAASVIVDSDTSNGSGSVILQEAERTIVLTAHHVVEGAEDDRVTVLVPVDGAEPRSVAARVVALDPEHDLALVATDGRIPREALALARAAPDLYDEILVVSAPLGFSGIADVGVLDSKLFRWPGHATLLWQVTGLVFFGSSGGAVTNRRGELVAVPVAFVGSEYGGLSQLGLCVPLPDIVAFLRTTPLAAALGL